MDTVTKRFGGAKWRLRVSCKEATEEDLIRTISSDEPPGFRVLKDNNVRTIYVGAPDFLGRRGVFLKKYKPRHGVLSFLKGLFLHSRAWWEWHVASRLARLGIESVRPLALAEEAKWFRSGKAFLLLEEIENAYPLTVVASNAFSRSSAGSEFEKKKSFLKSLAVFIRKLHEDRVYHRDLHGGNILVRSGNRESSECSAASFLVIDLHSVWFVPFLFPWQRIANLAYALRGLMPLLNRTDLMRFLSYYNYDDTRRSFLRRLYRHVLSRMEKIHRVQVNSRVRRCIKDSSQFRISRSRRGKIFHRRTVSEKLVNDIIEEHGHIVESGDGQLLKRTLRTAVTIVPFGEEKFCVKEYMSKGWAERVKRVLNYSRAKRAWVSARLLDVLGIPTPRAVALVLAHSFSNSSDYLISGYVDDCVSLKDYFEEQTSSKMNGSRTWCKMEFRTRRKFLDGLASFVARLHSSGVYHDDLSAKNILVREKDGRLFDFFLIDTESVRKKRSIRLRRIVKNLGQLNDLPSSVSRSERLYFFRAYMQGFGRKIDVDGEKSIVRMITEYTVKRVARRIRLFGRAYPSVP